MNERINYCVKKQLNNNSDYIFSSPYSLFWNGQVRVVLEYCSDSIIIFPTSSISVNFSSYFKPVKIEGMKQIQSLQYSMIREAQRTSIWMSITHSKNSWNILAVVDTNYHSSLSKPIFKLNYACEKHYFFKWSRHSTLTSYVFNIFLEFVQTHICTHTQKRHRHNSPKYNLLFNQHRKLPEYKMALHIFSSPKITLNMKEFLGTT